MTILPKNNGLHEVTAIPYEMRNRNPLNKWINNRLDHITQQAISTYISEYATRPDGTQNDVLANRIRYEISRRSQMGREIDVLEPARWAAYSGVISVFSSATAKLVGDRLGSSCAPTLNGDIVKNTLIATAISAAFVSAITLGRVFSFARFQSGLYAGAQTALALYDEKLPTLQNDEHHTSSFNSPESILTSWQSRIQTKASPAFLLAKA